MKHWRFIARISKIPFYLLLLSFISGLNARAATITASDFVSVSAIVGIINPGGGGSSGGGVTIGSGGSAGFVTFPVIIDTPELLPDISLDPIPRVCGKSADYNCDGRVNILDFSILLYWFDRVPVLDRIDLNEDGQIDLADFSIMAFYWTG